MAIRRVNRDALYRFGGRVRRRLWLTFVAFGVGAGATWKWSEEVFNLLLIPGANALSPFDGVPVFIGPTAMFGATVGLAIRGGLVTAAPVLVVGAYTLFRPALPDSAHRFIVLFVPATIACFVGGAAFAYFVMLPRGVGFLLNFGTDIAHPLITIDTYLDLMYAMMLWLGAIFELPVAMYLAARTRLISYGRMAKLRKFVPAAAFIFAAIITPTFDPWNSTLLAVPIIALYEVGLFLAWVAHPEDGNYLFIKTIGGAIRAVVLAPYTVPRWAFRKVVRR